MIDIPKWLSSHFERENFSCPKCNSSFDAKNITVVGIRAVENSTKTILYIEYMCPKCEGKIGFQIFEMTLEELAVSIMDDEPEDNENTQHKSQYNKDPAQKAKKRETQPPAKRQRVIEKTKITLEEKKNAVKMLNEAGTWVDWLSSIGAPLDTPEDKPSNFHISDQDNE